jgi:hypothetical protein
MKVRERIADRKVNIGNQEMQEARKSRNKGRT